MAGRRGLGGVRVVYEDRDIFVVDKPSGLLTIGTDREKNRTLQAKLGAHVRAGKSRERVFIVHRLDRDASGLLVFARTPEAKHGLQDQFRRREAGRTYLALVHGAVADDEQTFRSYLAENAALKVYSTRDAARGKLAITHVRVRRRFERTTLVEAHLETGRKHQIRVHLAEAGHPILGDRRYGPDEPASRRLALHAVELRFRHPRSGEKLEFRSDLPRDFPPIRDGAARRASMVQGGVAGSPASRRQRGPTGRQPGLHEQGQERDARRADPGAPGGRQSRVRSPRPRKAAATGTSPARTERRRRRTSRPRGDGRS